MSDEERQHGIGIAELAQRAGVTPRTVRYYVAEGLLPAPAGRGQRRAYGPEHLERLDAIRQLKSAYLPLHEIRRRLAAPPSPPPSSSSPRPASPSPPSNPPLPRTGDDVDVVDVRAAQRVDVVDVRAAQRPGEGASSPVAVAAVATRPPIGFGGAPGVGRIEIYDPPETVWRRHPLAPGVELHYRETDDPRLAEAILRLIREAGAILDGRPPAQPIRKEHHD